MGLNGVYFRQTIPQPSVPQRAPVPVPQPPALPQSNNSRLHFQEIASASATQMVDSSSAQLLEEIRSKAKKSLIWPWVLTLSVVALIFIAGTDPSLQAALSGIIVSGILLVWAVNKDSLRKTVILFYDLEPHIEQAYQNLHSAMNGLRDCKGLWHIDSRANVNNAHDRKVNAGATMLVKRKSATLGVPPPSYFKCNVAIPSLSAGTRTLYFLPDRILVWDHTGIGAISFDKFDVTAREERFIESDGVPSDSRVVDTTWEYVNKKGGPDRRFKDNRQLPVVLYEAILLTSKTGLQELLQASRLGVGGRVHSAIKGLSAAISQRMPPPIAAVYLKCSCNSCGLHIEFPDRAVGAQVACPHCGANTTLFQENVTT